MKKKMISLKSLRETLSANELKNILGGSTTHSDLFPGTCGWRGESADGVPVGECNVSKGHAIEMSSLFEGWWCCDSCSSTGYCG